MLNAILQCFLVESADGSDVTADDVLKNITTVTHTTEKDFSSIEEWTNFVENMLYVIDPIVLRHGTNDAHKYAPVKEDTDFWYWYPAYKLALCCDKTPLQLITATLTGPSMDVVRKYHADHVDDCVCLLIGRAVLDFVSFDKISRRIRRVTDFGLSYPHITTPISNYLDTFMCNDDNYIEAYAWVLQHNIPLTVENINLVYAKLMILGCYILDRDLDGHPLIDFLAQPELKDYSPIDIRNAYYNNPDIAKCENITGACKQLQAFLRKD